jgi:hypothetical protein
MWGALLVHELQDGENACLYDGYLIVAHPERQPIMKWIEDGAVHELPLTPEVAEQRGLFAAIAGHA